jgi:hypothetical protein
MRRICVCLWRPHRSSDYPHAQDGPASEPASQFRRPGFDGLRRMIQNPVLYPGIGLQSPGMFLISPVDSHKGNKFIFLFRIRLLHSNMAPSH